MELEQWDGRSLGAGPVVISADWDAGQPSDWGQFLYASAGPTHHPVRVPCSAFGRFLMAHRGLMFLSRDVPAVVTPLIDLLRGHGERGTDQLVSAWTSAGSWVDVFQLLCQVVAQQARWPEKLDEAALHGVHELAGDDKTGGLEKLVVIAKGTLALCAQFKRLTAHRHRGHQLLAELFGELRQWAAPLLDEASAAAVECSPLWHIEPHDDAGRRAEFVKPLPGTDDLVASDAWELLGNRIEVWSGVASRGLERAELLPAPEHIEPLHQLVTDRQTRLWETAHRHHGLEACFRLDQDRGPVPVPDKLTGWLADQARGLCDDDYVVTELSPAGDPPSIEQHGFWGATIACLSVCRELLRCHAVSVLLGRCNLGSVSGHQATLLDAYRRVARPAGRSLFTPPRGYEFWLVKPRTLGLHALAAVLYKRGHYAGALGRFHYLLADGYKLDPGFGADFLIASELESLWTSARGTPSSPTCTVQAGTPERTQAFLDRVRLEDPSAIDWVRTARALTDTATFGVPSTYLKCIFHTDYGLKWSETDIERLRSTLSGHVITELAGYWEDQRVIIAARRLGLPDEEVYARLQDQTRCLAELGSTPRSQLRATLGSQLMKDVVAGGNGRVVSLLDRLRAEHSLCRTATTTQLLRALLLTRGITAGGRIVGPGYESEVRHDEWVMTCEEVRLGAVQELLADGLSVLAATPEEILLRVPAGRADPAAIRESAERGGQRVLGQFGCRFEVEHVRTW